MLKALNKYCLFVVLFASLLFSEAIEAQFDIPEKPSKSQQTAVYDYIELLRESEANALQRKLINYADTTSTQFVVVIISSTNGEDISFLGAKWGQKWGIGQADEDNGILIILARDDRTVDINTGYGIEYRITDRMAEQVINRYMIPEFKNGNYYSGLDSGTDVMMQMLAGEFQADPRSDFPFGYVIFIVLFILFLIIMIRASRKGSGGKNGGSGGGMGSLWDIIILSNAGRTGGSWGSGSSGGGSFGGGGFGGGGFGGGGASGSW